MGDYKTKSCVDCSMCSNELEYGSDAYECTSDNEVDQSLFKRYGINAASKCSGYETYENNKHSPIPLDMALRFILAGRSEFTLLSDKTRVKFAYRLKKRKVNKEKEKENKYLYYVTVLKGGERIYAGVLYYSDLKKMYMFSTGKKGKMTGDNIEIKSLMYVINKLNERNYGMRLTIYHVGRCGRCGRVLTVPESIMSGLGPECITKVKTPDDEL